jgi:hypothetical protein
LVVSLQLSKIQIWCTTLLVINTAVPHLINE